MFVLRSSYYLIAIILNFAPIISLCMPEANKEDSNVDEQNTKVYVLFVWGTEDENLADSTQISREKIESLFRELENAYPEGVFETTRLQAEAAHPINIIKACERIAKKAGPNDAILVYALCHGAVFQYSDGKFRHGLSPIAKSGDSLDLESIGIRRGTIMRILDSYPHRLNALITDSCSGVYLPNKIGRPGLPQSLKGVNASDCYLASILIKARGNININSTRLSSRGRPAELANGYVVRGVKPNQTTEIFKKVKSSGVESLDKRELEVYRFGGTVFTNAFFEVASKRDYDQESVNVESFIDVLREEQHRYYKVWFDYLISVGVSGRFISQQTQTVTQYDEDGVPILED